MRYGSKHIIPAVVIFVIFTILLLTGCGEETNTVEKTNWSLEELSLPDDFSVDSMSVAGGTLTLSGWRDETPTELTLDLSDGSMSWSDAQQSDGWRTLNTFTSEKIKFVVEANREDGELAAMRLRRIDKNKTTAEYDCGELFGVDIAGFGGNQSAGEGVFKILFAGELDNKLYVVSNTGAVRVGKNETVRVESATELTSARLKLTQRDCRLIVSDAKNDYEVSFEPPELIGIDREPEKKPDFNPIELGIPGMITSTVTDGENFYLLSFDIFGQKESLWKVSPITGSDKRTILTLAVVACTPDDQTKNAVADFNRTNDNYRIKLKTYSDGSGSPAAEAEAFSRDVISGEIPDIILISPEYSDVESLAAKGLFADLRGFMTDPERGNYTGGDFTAPLVAEVRALLGRSADFPDGLSAEVLLDKLGSLPEDQALTAATKFSELLRLSLDEFIDPETGETRFDSELFRRFAAAFRDFGNGYHSGAVTTSNRFEAFASGEVLLSHEPLDVSIIAKYRLLYGIDDLSIFGSAVGGVPMLEVKVCAGISSKSEKNGAWEFLKLRLSDAYSLNRSTAIPVATRSALAKYLDSIPRYIYIEGNLMTQSAEKLDKPGGFELTDEIFGKIKAAVGSARAQTRLEKTLVNIIIEESDSWKKRGGDLDGAIKIIENRVTTIHSENK